MLYKIDMEISSEKPTQIEIDHQVADQVFTDIFAEIIKAGKIPAVRPLRQLIRALLRKPIANFSHFIARIDALTRDYGFVETSKIAIQELSGGARARGVNNIPTSGPVIIASNHPGTYDGFALLSNLKREDFKVMVSGIPFFRNLPHASKYLIYSTHDVNDRMQAVRQSIHHLEGGGVVMIFPSGRIDPDPAVLPGAEHALSQWSRSIEVFMRKVPDTALVLAITSGVLSKEFTRHLYPRLFKNDHEQRRVMEFMQVIKQMARGKPVSVDPCVSFAEPIRYFPDSEQGLDGLGERILTQAQSLLEEHLSAFSLPRF
jgi:1-acyl-sn-glycerol-3-phosphate acyltransferase